MLKEKNVPTFYDKNYIKKYSSKENYIKTQNVNNKVHNPRFKNVLCKFFLQNNCTRDKDCVFSHNLNDFTDEEIMEILEETEKNKKNEKKNLKEEVKFISPF